MAIKTIESLNDSGKLEKIKIVTPIQKYHFEAGTFYVTSFELDRLLIEKEYTSLEMRLLCCLKLQYDYNNQMQKFTQKYIAKEIKSTQQNVSKALKKLLKDGIIEYDKDSKIYSFNDKYIIGNGDNKRENRNKKKVLKNNTLTQN